MARHDSSAALQAITPDFSEEEGAFARGYRCVAGVDEAGRGPLAGPVVAAAVVLDPRAIPEGLNDSKKLTEARRRGLFEQLLGCARVGFCAAPVSLIDALNIRGATLWAMVEALKALPVRPDLALIDGRDLPPGLPCAGEWLIGGDGRSFSVAAASIVAKVVRDEMCQVMDCGHPHYGFSRHKGYSTPVHMQALDTHGPTDLHRQSFAPVMAARR